ncbi:MAG: host attachment protein [Rhodobacteraceae bacterium]|nr:host attachment protein [Paracoccaceae bacterium]
MEHGKLWALVMNATRARILRGVRKDSQQGETELVLRAPHRALRDIMSDRPGRTAASSGRGRRSAMEYASDPVREDAVAFAKEVVVLLETHRKAGDFDRLAVFASQDMLGIVRKELTDGLKATVTVEVAKNLMHETESDLMRIVAQP